MNSNTTSYLIWMDIIIPFYILETIAIKVCKHTVTIREVLIKIMTIICGLEYNYSGS